MMMKWATRAFIATAALIAALPGFAVNVVAFQDADAALGGGWDALTLGGSSWICENYSGATSVIGHAQFDLSAFSPGSVTSATLELYHEFNTQGGSSFDVLRVVDPWSDATLSGTNAPTLDATVWANLAIGDNGTQVIRSVDVTALVQGWVNGTFANNGLALLRNPNTSPWPYFRSENNGTGPGPTLVINAVPEPATLAVVGAGLAALIRRRRK